MKLLFLESSWEDYTYWQRTDKKISQKIQQLIQDIFRHPYEGIGKPEQLKFDFSGCWSRRIDLEHRLIYQIQEDTVVIIQCRYHY